jgi:murein L,D-transpeptidase YcbB/YkuD
MAIAFALAGVLVCAGLAAPMDPTPSAAQTPTETALARWIDAGNLPDLRWPNFSDYREAVRSFYVASGNALAWSSQGLLSGVQPTPAALAAIAELEKADSKGLRAADYDGGRWQARLARLAQSGSPPTDVSRESFDLALTVCLMRYLSDLRGGRVNPQAVPFELQLGDKEYDLPQFLRDQILEAKPADLPGLIAGVEPPYEGYRRLEQTVQVYAALAAKDSAAPLPKPAKSIAPGDPYPGLPRLVEFLKMVGDLPANAQTPLDPPIYQEPVVTAVKSFQLRHGLDSDGRLGRATIAAMNVPLSWRAEQLRLTLERWRWAPQVFGQPPIIVNVPEFTLRARGPDNHTQLKMRVVVGGALGHRTPVFGAQLRYLIFRPYWNVPMSIQRNELAPKIRDDREYLASNDYEVVTRSGDVVTNGAVDDQVLAQLEAGRLFIRQRPGPQNSLGLVKFLFPNPYDVYMHSTPAIALFEKSRRDFSHGCIRVQDPVALAVWALRGNPGWDRDRVIAVMNGSADNVRVNLVQPIPVLIVYGTAVAAQDTKVYFYNDIYGYDAELEQELARGYPYR